jgi:phosphatidylinositol alpha 1,6-mannosyltransferase
MSELPLRIALFTGNYNYIRDGVALTLNRLVRFLHSRGVEVLVFAPTGPKPAFDSFGTVIKVPAFPLPFRPEYLVATGLPTSARKTLAEFKPHLFHIAIPDILGYQALRFAKKSGIPVVSSFHTRFDTYLSFYKIGFLETLGQRYLRHFYRQCAQVYPPSRSMADIISAAGYSDDIRIWSRGVETDVFTPEKRDMAWRQSLGIADTDVVINFTSRVVKEKNTVLFADVLQRLKARGVKFHTLIVGDGPELENLKKAAPNVISLGTRGGAELTRAYASSDIFFFPSESETFGNVTLEACASGLACVCADASGSRSIIINSKTGFLIDAKQTDRFVDQLEKLAADPVLRKSIGNAARVHAKSFSWDAILSELLANYREAVATAHQQEP